MRIAYGTHGVERVEGGFHQLHPFVAQLQMQGISF